MASADVCPTEDAVQAFLEYLVDPKLPAKSSARASPSASEEEAIAKQVRSLVLLYNYFYRKQHPELEFLGFEEFCKLLVILRPSLLAYMRLMQRSNDSELDDLDNQLSLTEKKIMEACDVCKSLPLEAFDASEGLPIYSVSVLLVDFKKLNCFLQFGSTTEGIWSMIEKCVNVSKTNSKASVVATFSSDKKMRFVRKPAEAGIDEATCKQLAFSAVKEAAGINESDLVVLRSSVTYSMNKEKEASRCYIMQFTKPGNHGIVWIPIEAIIDSLCGPLLIKTSSGWTHNSVLGYFHLLPYAAIVSEWFSSKALSSSLVQIQQTTSDNIITKGSINTERQSKSFELKKNVESCLSKSSNDDLGKTPSLGSNQFLFTTQSKDEGKYVVNQIEFDKAKTTSLVRVSNGPSTDHRPQARMDEQKTKRNVNERSDGNLANPSPNCNNVSSAGNELSKGYEKVHVTLAASEHKELTQAALRVILSERDKLSLQQREIGDEIAECDQKIQAILNDGEDNIALKVESIIKHCNEICPRSAAERRGCQHNGEAVTHCFKRKRLSDTKQSPCQELDEVCCENIWILPTYSVFPMNGQFQAIVTVKGTMFEHTSGGELRSNAGEARESAASEMLAKLQT